MQYQMIELQEVPNMLRRRISLVLLLCVALPLCIICFYAFGTGLFQTYQQARYKPFIFRPAALLPPELKDENADDCRQEKKQAFKAGYALAKLEQIWE